MKELKIGDKVKIKSLDWYKKNKNINGNVDVKYIFTFGMSEYCGEIFKLGHCDNNENCYSLKTLNGENVSYTWSREMFDLGNKNIQLELF